MQRPLIIGTRGSPLALYQARKVQSLLGEHHGGDMEAAFPIRVYTTSGDKLTGELAQFGGKGLFTKELEVALGCGDVDLAVHSMKDVPTVHQPGLRIAAVLAREDPRDAFISKDNVRLDALPRGAVVGTASLRRRAQIAHKRPDMKFSLLRGNVGTRLMKLEAGDCEATILALAGLKRLGMAGAATEIMDLDIMLNAPAQGAIGIECRDDDLLTQSHIGVLNHIPTHLCITAERAFLRKLDGSCRTPIAALATVNGPEMVFRGEVYSLDGQEKFTVTDTTNVIDLRAAEQFGTKMGADIHRQIGGRNLWG